MYASSVFVGGVCVERDVHTLVPVRECFQKWSSVSYPEDLLRFH